MLKSLILSLASAACLTSVLAAPAPVPQSSTETGQPLSNCDPKTASVRYDFDNMAPADRKAFTDAINCLRTKPSTLDPNVYPAAINRFFDWAVVHVNYTRVVHLDGFFLPWHRTFIHLFEQDLKEQCGFQGTMPYWNWPATADDLTGSNIFSGDEYSMSGDGYYVNTGPYKLAPGFEIQHGTGGGCIKSGPFQGMNYTMPIIDINFLLNGTAPPHSVFNRVESCLTRDLNTYAAQTWNNYTAVQVAVESADISTFNTALNGVFGGTQLGIHSGAHFIMGPPASNIFVSAQDPIWYPLHTMLDRTYVSWQSRHPDMANATFGTMTANNAPPSANVTLDSVIPGFGPFGCENTYTIGQLLNTTQGPFCYVYDTQI